MARVLGGKYFHGGSLMHSELGLNPSYTWRSIWEAKQVLESGMRRRVGDGLSTRIWKDPWIPSTQTKRVISPRGNNDEEMLVVELLNADGRSWNSQKVRSLFLPFEQERVMNIKWSSVNSCDIWCWDAEKHGIYSVPTAYKLLMNGFVWEEGQSNVQREKQLWNSIWKMLIWPCIKVFFSQLMSNALPTRANLVSPMKHDDDACPVCDAKTETVVHLLFFLGGGGSGFWAGLGLEIEEVGRVKWVRERMEMVWRELREDKRVLSMAGCYTIWEGRSKVVFEG
ncbi:uncharacterized protein LOC141648829 [Silene latifolia]|uniref:uncharacterized protein LOC141648829 n=1 Tax=Silene latifolia TaxID=37657 RepID=UPI003D76F07B